MFKRRVVVPLETRFAQAVLEHAADGFLLLQNGRFTLCNAAAERVYQRTRHEIIGATPDALAAPRQADGRPSSEHVGERWPKRSATALRASSGSMSIATACRCACW
jgi:methyl-accepting chemotaxis protein